MWARFRILKSEKERGGRRVLGFGHTKHGIK